MRRTTHKRALLVVAVTAAALAVTGGGSAATPKTVNGTVGPGFTISLTMLGKHVTRLNAGTPPALAMILPAIGLVLTQSAKRCSAGDELFVGSTRKMNRDSG